MNFTTEEVDNDELPLGESNVVQEGVNGYTNVTYEITFHDGIEVSREETKREVIAPIPEIIENGTLEEDEDDEG